ncbi:unnamed protein product [Orchesella dallaii]|uniref:Uncharacterized protein n=1 Tax=Orchesella dallaii TaxID=48710 RepID=A0ABP1Q5Y8_9HEXA
MQFWNPNPFFIQCSFRICIFVVLFQAFVAAEVDSGNKTVSDEIEVSKEYGVTGNSSSISNGETFKDCVFKWNPLEEHLFNFENKERQIKKYPINLKVGIRNYSKYLIGGVLEGTYLLKEKLKRLLETSLDEPATAISIDRMTAEIFGDEKEITISIEVPGMTKYIVYQMVGTCGDIEVKTPIRRHRADALFDDEDSSMESSEQDVIPEVKNEALKIESKEFEEEVEEADDDCDHWDSGCSMAKQNIQDSHNAALKMDENTNEIMPIMKSDKESKESTFQFKDEYHDQQFSVGQINTKPSTIFTFVLFVTSCICRPLFQHL